MSNVVSPAIVHAPGLNQSLDRRYQINEVLATQLWGRTYLAHDLRRPSQSECIIHHFKQIPEIPNYTAFVRSLFAKEVALLEAFGMHEQIPQLLACFEDEDGFYVVQEFVEGRSLSQALTPDVPWSDQQVVTLLREVLKPLSFIHDRGGLHGNLKPDNLVRRQDGRLVLIDFGSMPQIQRECLFAYGLEGDLTHLSEPGYQPVEQLQGLPCAASDVYAVGMIAAQALTGKHPTQFQIDPQSGEVLWLSHYEEAVTVINRGLAGVVNGMVQGDVSRRFGSAGETLQALQTVVCLSQNGARFAKSCSFDTPITVPVPATVPHPQTGITGSDREPIVPPVTKQPFVLARLLIGAIANPSVRIGVGGTALSAIVTAIGWNLLNSVNWSQPNPMLETVSKKLQKTQRLVKAELATPERVQTGSGAWLQDWTRATQTIQQAEQAFNRGNWSEVRQITQSMSTQIPYWQDQGKALEKQVIAKAEADSKNLLQTAYDRAQDHDFTTALTMLKQIMPETTAGAIARSKMAEYTAKRAIKAQSDLQKAYDRAILRDFSQALTYLGQIPQGTPASAIAQKKVVEYSRKAQIRAQLMLKAAADYADQQNFVAALTALEKIPSGTLPDDVIEQKLTEYTAKLNQQAAQWLQQADIEAARGRKATAIAFLQKVPIGTLAYAQAREQLAVILHRRGYANAQTSAINPRNLTSKSVQNLNPGTYLREAAPLIALL